MKSYHVFQFPPNNIIISGVCCFNGNRDFAWHSSRTPPERKLEHVLVGDLVSCLLSPPLMIANVVIILISPTHHNVRRILCSVGGPKIPQPCPKSNENPFHSLFNHIVSEKKWFDSNVTYYKHHQAHTLQS